MVTIENVEYENMLDVMLRRQIFNIEKSGKMFKMIEECDRYFKVEITKEQLLALADEIKAFAERK